MEVIIGIGIGVVIALLTGKKRQARKPEKINRNSAVKANNAQAEHQRKKEVSDEIITVTLPTINSDK